jgi:hypothetical protein
VQTRKEKTQCLTKIQNISGSGSGNITVSEMQAGEYSGRMRDRDSMIRQNQRSTCELHSALLESQRPFRFRKYTWSSILGWAVGIGVVLLAVFACLPQVISALASRI